MLLEPEFLELTSSEVQLYLYFHYRKAGHSHFETVPVPRKQVLSDLGISYPTLRKSLARLTGLGYLTCLPSPKRSLIIEFTLEKNRFTDHQRTLEETVLGNGVDEDVAGESGLDVEAHDLSILDVF